jgi:opacity protein-like surface antigen
MRLALTLVALLWIAGVSAAAPLGSAVPKVGFGVHGDFTLANLPGPVIAGSAPLEDAYGLGVGGGVHLDVGLPGLSLRLSGDYLTYSLDEGKFRDSYAGVFGGAANQISIDGGKLSIKTVSANAKAAVVPLPVVKPYVTGGVGLAWLSTDETRTSIAGVAGRTFPAATQNGKTSFNVGAGADLDLGLKLFVEVRYVWIATEGQTSTYVPVTLGVTF